MEQIFDIVVQILMRWLFQFIPAQFSCFTPFMFLTEVLTHEQQLLTGMAHHEGITCLEVGKLVITKAWHLIEHGALEMDDFIVGKNKNELFRICIGHTECHLVVVELTEIWIQLHVIQEVMHPAHVPLVSKAKTIIFRCFCNLRPCCGFFRNDECSVFSSTDQRIQMLEEFHCIQVAIAAILIGNPLSILTSIVQIQHGCNRIYT